MASCRKCPHNAKNARLRDRPAAMARHQCSGRLHMDPPGRAPPARLTIGIDYVGKTVVNFCQLRHIGVLCVFRRRRTMGKPKTVGRLNMRALLATAGIGLLLAGSSAQAGTLYATGFEPPTFTTGVLAGQDGWSEFPAPFVAVQVENTFVKTGTQAVEVVPEVTIGQDGPYKAVSTTAPIVVQSI
jgi:hypothetical protein